MMACPSAGFQWQVMVSICDRPSLVRMRRRETLMMAAHLRLPEAMSNEAKEAYVDGIIQRLGMTKSADTIVGDAKVRTYQH